MIVSVKIRSFEGLDFKELRMRKMIWLKKKKVRGGSLG